MTMTLPATYSAYTLGQLVRCQATFVSTDGVTPADPSTVMLFVRNGLGSVASYLYGAAGASIIRNGAGAYVRDVTVDTDGEWAYHFRGTGGVQAAEEWGFTGRKSRIFNL
jgi:hypothetical protein